MAVKTWHEEWSRRARKVSGKKSTFELTNSIYLCNFPNLLHLNISNLQGQFRFKDKLAAASQNKNVWWVDPSQIENKKAVLL